MTITRRVTVAAVLCLGARLRAQKTVDEPRFLASEVTPWTTVGRDGANRMNLVGRETPSPTEFVSFRERYPASFMCDSTAIRVQRHLGTQQIQVLRGTLMLGLGTEVDLAKATPYGPGSFIAIPSGVAHYEWNRGELEIQVDAIGRPRITPFRRADGTTSEPSPTTFVAARCTPPAAASTAVAAAAPDAGEWRVNGIASMLTLAGDPKSPTELRAFRWKTVADGIDRSHAVFHYHWGTEHVTMWKGTIYIVLGPDADYAKAKAYGPGSFIEIPAGMPHLEWFAAGENEALVQFVGPSGAVDLQLGSGKAK